MISDESDRFNPRDERPADAGKPSKSEKRRAARQLATQALYQRHMAGTSLNEIEAQFRVDNDFTFADQSYFHDILHGVNAASISVRLKSWTRLNWPYCACPPGSCSSASTCRTVW